MPPNTCSSLGPRSEHPARSSGESHLFAANVYQQDELRGVNKVELSPVNKVIPSDKLERTRDLLLGYLN
jgi:hypothetical protein